MVEPLILRFVLLALLTRVVVLPAGRRTRVSKAPAHEAGIPLIDYARRSRPPHSKHEQDTCFDVGPSPRLLIPSEVVVDFEETRQKSSVSRSYARSL